MCSLRQRPRFQKACEQILHLGAVQFERRCPVKVVLLFEYSLRLGKDFERLRRLLNVHQPNAHKRPGFGFLVFHAELLEALGGSLGEVESVTGKVQVQIDLRFIQVA